MLPTQAPDISTIATQSQVLQALASLAGLPSRQADDDGIDKAMYFVALEGVSRFALFDAVKAIIRGGLGHTFFPSPVEFRQQCDRIMAPHIREAERIRLRERQACENAEYERKLASRTPEGMARARKAYEDFCRSSDATRSPSQQQHITLDPELLAKIPDAATSFQKARI